MCGTQYLARLYAVDERQELRRVERGLHRVAIGRGDTWESVVVLSNNVPLGRGPGRGPQLRSRCQAVHRLCCRLVMDFVKCVALEQHDGTREGLELLFGQIADGC